MGTPPVVLAIDVGGTHVKFLASNVSEKRRRFVSGPALGPKEMVEQVRALTSDWSYDAVSIGYPGAAVDNRIVREPYNLGPGWLGFDFAAAFGRPVKLMNDAAMQALGSYEGRKMLFLSLGTGLGAALIVEGVVLPTELAHLPYRRATFEDHIGKEGLARHGKRKWRRLVADVVARLVDALLPQEVVLGGGNVGLLAELPPLCRAGSNANAFVGGFRAWGLKAEEKKPAAAT